MAQLDKLNADQARIRYFNDYVELEHNLRDLIRKIDPKVKTKNKSLREIIVLIKQKNKHPIKINSFFIHLKIRNWLAHTRKTVVCSGKMVSKMNQIKKINIYIKKVL